MPIFWKNPFPKFSFSLKYKVVVLAILVFLLSTLSFYQVLHSNQKQNVLVDKLSQKESLIASISARATNLLKENQIILNDNFRQELETINQTIEKYETIKEKTASYKTQGVSVSSVETELPKAVDLILSKKYSEADTLLTSLDSSLETALKAKQTADAAASKKTTTTTTCTSIPASGYCKTTVNGFSVHVITGNAGSVVTDTANSSDCINNCPTKSLASYISANGGYAGMNGTYFCPPDYAVCASKISSYDFPVYNSNLGLWLNYGNILWNDRAMMAFTSSGATFYPQANSYSGQTVRAAIVNHPGLVHNGANVVGNYNLTSSQNTIGTRGGVGIKGSTVYLVVASSATVNDFAGIMVGLGVTHALNLDGGGSSALYYNGSYKVGPGRLLPNALILK